MICPYCEGPAVLLRWQEPGYPYPADWGPAWKCGPCDAYVRCYAGGTRPLGTLAEAGTRMWRGRAHKALDGLWSGGEMSRDDAYRWLADVLGILREQAHIGLMDPEECSRVIQAVALRRLDR